MLLIQGGGGAYLDKIPAEVSVSKSLIGASLFSISSFALATAACKRENVVEAEVGKPEKEPSHVLANQVFPDLLLFFMGGLMTWMREPINFTRILFGISMVSSRFLFFH